MKITFTCKLTMTEVIDESEGDTVYPTEVIVEGLLKDLKDGVSEKGTVDISDYSVTVE